MTKSSQAHNKVYAFTLPDTFDMIGQIPIQRKRGCLGRLDNNRVVFSGGQEGTTWQSDRSFIASMDDYYSWTEINPMVLEY